jgi:hypothetical protein
MSLRGTGGGNIFIKTLLIKLRDSYLFHSDRAGKGNSILLFYFCAVGNIRVLFLLLPSLFFWGGGLG